MEKYDLIIVGGGTAGMMAAIRASELGQKVLLLEKMDQAGRKLRITGKGRCNLTNTLPLNEFLQHVGSDNQFLRNVFSVFFSKELIQFFEKRGVRLIEERGKRIFPASGKAQDIFMALITGIEKSSIKVMKPASVVELLVKNNENEVEGVRLQSGKMLFAPKVILATGGKSYPLTGSTGDGYRMAQQLGHTLVEPLPTLVPLLCKNKLAVDDTKGFQLKNVQLSVFENDKKIAEAFGDMTLMFDCITGPIVLSVSRILTKGLHEGKEYECRLDFKPALDEQTMDKKLIREIDENGTRIFEDMLRLWLPKDLIKMALAQTVISTFKRGNQLNAQDRKKIFTLLKQFPIVVNGTKDFDEAIVTQGGISLKEINPKTLESKLVKGLFFAGEIMDLDADTGGYNLQIAFSTGYVAGS